MPHGWPLRHRSVPSWSSCKHHILPRAAGGRVCHSARDQVTRSWHTGGSAPPRPREVLPSLAGSFEASVVILESASAMSLLPCTSRHKGRKTTESQGRWGRVMQTTAVKAPLSRRRGSCGTKCSQTWGERRTWSCVALTGMLASVTGVGMLSCLCTGSRCRHTGVCLGQIMVEQRERR